MIKTTFECIFGVVVVVVVVVVVCGVCVCVCVFGVGEGGACRDKYAGYSFTGLQVQLWHGYAHPQESGI